MRSFIKYIFVSLIVITALFFFGLTILAFSLSFITCVVAVMYLTGHVFEIIINKLAMRIVIKKNHRRPFLFSYWFPVVLRRRYWTFTRTFMFTSDTLYKFGNPHDLDVNKLFGLSGGFNHLKNSIRFGWNIAEDMQKINIFAYERYKGKFKFNKIAELPLNKWYTFQICFMLETAVLSVYDENNNIIMKPFLIKFKRSFFEYKLGIYFGGEMRAPKDIVFLKTDK